MPMYGDAEALAVDKADIDAVRSGASSLLDVQFIDAKIQKLPRWLVLPLLLHLE